VAVAGSAGGEATDVLMAGANLPVGQCRGEGPDRPTAQDVRSERREPKPVRPARPAHRGATRGIAERSE